MSQLSEASRLIGITDCSEELEDPRDRVLGCPILTTFGVRGRDVERNSWVDFETLISAGPTSIPYRWPSQHC